MRNDVFSLTLCELGREIETGGLDPVELADAFLARIEEADPDRKIFVRLIIDRTRAEAMAARERAKAGVRRSLFDGVPLSWKDNVDTAGEVTAAGSALLKNRRPMQDAEALKRATRAGLVFLGKTNMTEFAYSGLGINPVTGTPPNPFDDTTPRAPGGSSSGAGASVARSLAPAAIGTDTAGSVRVPAAWNGLFGFRGTTGRVPTTGIVPLSPSLDIAGPLTRTVEDAGHLFALLSRTPPVDLAGTQAKDLVLAVPKADLMDKLEEGVKTAFDTALEALRRAGARVETVVFPEFDALFALAADHGLIAPPEALALWQDTLDANPDAVFPAILDRFRAAAPFKATDLATTQIRARALAASVTAKCRGYSALALPAVPISPPRIADLEHDIPAHQAANARCLSHTLVFSMFHMCAMTIPAGMTPPSAEHPALPFGLMLAQAPHADPHLLRASAAAARPLAMHSTHTR